MSVTNLHLHTSTKKAEHPIAQLVSAVRQHFTLGLSKDYQWRVNQLKRLRLMVVENQDKLASALYEDLGKGEVESWTSEIGFVISDIDHTIKHLKGWMKPRRVSTPIVAQPGKSYILPEPLGTVLIIGAWNYPFQLVVAPLIAAIAAGNHAIIKPSELSQSTSALLKMLLPKYLDDNAFAVVEGAVEETQILLAQKFDHIIYTGGEKVGKIVMRAASEHLTPVTLELGGKSPCIVDKHIDIEVTAKRIVWAKWMNAGQTCVAPDYVLADAAIAGALQEALKKAVQECYGVEPKKSKDYGRIVNKRHYERLVGYLENQNVIFGGDVDPVNRYISPTIIREPSLHSSVMQEEIFGPILPIVTYDNLADAITFVNERAKPLSLYLFTHKSDVEKKVLQQTSSGSACVNDGFMFMVNPDLPFGGVGNSGMGAYHGKTGFDTFSHLKSVMSRKFWLDVPLRYPPFNRFKFTWLKRLL
ncbi:aldehyde dehydrogenase family protein [Aestuariibacter sp. AA17]|uniref:Aldehyde dehydrogenase n=1 Tax=Fluctibacter corallii TaxID=2984329 RepID=A0ABT3A7E3_9ALTE|nr:aldehyde dehydrogenase family protein [Aestuariibacter sp. AA17]MCV2884591.1 aldehyde dehydrogenase family protein [Aestuariibacter sp. AA17]